MNPYYFWGYIMEPVHYLLMKANTMVNQQILSRAAEIGLTPGQPKVLECLMTHEGCDQKTISAYCEIKPSTTGNILSGMERKGLIERRQTDGNRRSLYVYLTERGRETAVKMAAIFSQADALALQGMNAADIAQLKALLKQIMGTMESKRREGKRFDHEYE